MNSLRWIGMFWLTLVAACAGEPFALRGYYLTLMRMPVMGLKEWKQAVDCFEEDGANVIILWTAGGFRSKKFPVTWQHNLEHENIKSDFVRELIDYAHTKNIRVLLGFAPFGYDGVNRYAIEHPELKAKKADGTPVDEFGIDCWGWNLCASQAESQRFMREYISEMCFDFYPNAGGLLIESSDYNICRCPDCGAKYYDREFAFVRWISDEVWKRNSNATILVYPHYFAGGKVPGMDAVAARQEFDSRWGLAFSPHSSHFKPELIAKAHESIYWSDAPILGTPRRIMEAAQAARKNGVSGFVPSMEAFSYVTQHTEGGEESQVGLRRKPFGLDPLKEGKMPYRCLLARVQRTAFREYSQNPELDFGEFGQRLGKEVFGDGEKAEAIKDLLELQRLFTFESDWYWMSPLTEPDFFRTRAERLKWPQSKLAEYAGNLETLRRIARRYQDSTNSGEREMAGTAAQVAARWGRRSP